MEERQEEGLVLGYRIGKSAISQRAALRGYHVNFEGFEKFEYIPYRSPILVHSYVGELFQVQE